MIHTPIPSGITLRCYLTSCPGADLFLLVITAARIMMAEIVWRFQVIHSGSIIAGNFVLFCFIFLFLFLFSFGGEWGSRTCALGRVHMF